jgi:CheY-like chemotaxis protein
VVSNIHMPLVNGLELWRRLRADPESARAGIQRDARLDPPVRAYEFLAGW